MYSPKKYVVAAFESRHGLIFSVDIDPFEWYYGEKHVLM